MNVAIFISGRIKGYEISLPIFLKLFKEYNIKIFFSINTFSLDSNETESQITEQITSILGSSLGHIYFEPYKLPRSYVENKLSNGSSSFTYNALSHTYNDFTNFKNIEAYQIINGIQFDVLCKLRCDMIFHTHLQFIKDESEMCIIRHKHIEGIRYWGHIYKNTPIMVSDCFAYGNFKSMKIFCKTYHWILEKNMELKGQYTHANEIYLTDSILNRVFYNVPGGERVPIVSSEDIVNIYSNNTNNVKIIALGDNIHYQLMSHRHTGNFNADADIWKYTAT
jgi:hypothetical protein